MAMQPEAGENKNRRSRPLAAQSSAASALPASNIHKAPPRAESRPGSAGWPKKVQGEVPLRQLRDRNGSQFQGAERNLSSAPVPSYQLGREAEGEETRGKQSPESQKLLLEMAPLVRRVAFEMRQHLPPHVEMDDLVGAGTLGLVDALRKFDPSRKVKLESYARHRIRGGILDALRTLDPASRDMRRRARKVERTYRELEARLGRPVQGEEVARALGISLKVWHRWAQEVHALGFDRWQHFETAANSGKLPMREEGKRAVRQLTEDPFDLCYRREQRDLLNRALARLPERERLIVNLYYQQDLTMKEIAARLAVDESRVSQLHAEALQRLKVRVRASLSPRKKVAVAVARPSGLAA